MRCCVFCLVVSVVLSAPRSGMLHAQLATQPETTEPEFKAPDEILIRMPNGKQGFRDMRELKRHGFTYAYDADNSLPGEWSCLQISRWNQKPKVPEDNLSWMITCKVNDGELFPFLGQIYRCNTKTAQLVRIPDDVRKLRARPDRRFPFSRGTLPQHRHP